MFGLGVYGSDCGEFVVESSILILLVRSGGYVGFILEFKGRCGGEVLRLLCVNGRLL